MTVVMPVKARAFTRDLDKSSPSVAIDSLFYTTTCRDLKRLNPLANLQKLVKIIFRCYLNMYIKDQAKVCIIQFFLRLLINFLKLALTISAVRKFHQQSITKLF